MFKKVDMSNELKKGIKIGFATMGLIMLSTALGLTILLDFVVNIGGTFPVLLIILKSVVFGFSLWKGIQLYKVHKKLVDDNFNELKSLNNK